MKKYSCIIGAFLLLLLAGGEVYAQGNRNTTPGKHYKEKHVSKGTNRYGNSGSSGTVSNESSQAKTDSIMASQKTGSEAKKEFMKQSGFPMGRPGYVFDYKVPLDKGGCDCISNMQWITIDEAIKQGKLE
ncbi:MAG: hypothetical protein POELPBGB_00381 [Bacteroidia bacterium]|nr:hypothetical protein [Bacteroidia bacterium]